MPDATMPRRLASVPGLTRPACPVSNQGRFFDRGYGRCGRGDLRAFSGRVESGPGGAGNTDRSLTQDTRCDREQGFMDATRVIPPALLRRMIPNVEVDADNCWLWCRGGSVVRGGYRQIKIHNDAGRRVHRLAHRTVYEAWCGPIPTGMQIDHVCRKPTCCNPWHLEVVTAQENLARRDEARRLRIEADAAELAHWKHRALSAEASLSRGLWPWSK